MENIPWGAADFLTRKWGRGGKHRADVDSNTALRPKKRKKRKRPALDKEKKKPVGKPKTLKKKNTQNHKKTPHLKKKKKTKRAVSEEATRGRRGSKAIMLREKTKGDRQRWFRGKGFFGKPTHQHLFERREKSVQQQCRSKIPSKGETGMEKRKVSTRKKGLDVQGGRTNQSLGSVCWGRRGNGARAKMA